MGEDISSKGRSLSLFRNTLSREILVMFYFVLPCDCFNLLIMQFVFPIEIMFGFLKIGLNLSQPISLCYVEEVKG